MLAVGDVWTWRLYGVATVRYGGCATWRLWDVAIERRGGCATWRLLDVATVRHDDCATWRLYSVATVRRGDWATWRLCPVFVFAHNWCFVCMGVLSPAFSTLIRLCLGTIYDDSPIETVIIASVSPFLNPSVVVFKVVFGEQSPVLPVISLSLQACLLTYNQDKQAASRSCVALLEVVICLHQQGCDNVITWQAGVTGVNSSAHSL